MVTGNHRNRVREVINTQTYSHKVLPPSQYCRGDEAGHFEHLLVVMDGMEVVGGAFRTMEVC